MMLSRGLSYCAQLFRPVAAAVSACAGPRGCLLTFHRAASSSGWRNLPNREFYLDLTFFDQLLGYLKRTGWDVVSVEDAIRRSRRADCGDRYVNFSIDDGYRDTFEQVVPLFRRHNLPVTLFVTTGIPDGTVAMWWAGLEDVLSCRNRVKLEQGSIDVATGELKRQAYARIAREWEQDDPEERYAMFCRLNAVDVQEIHRKHAISWDMLDAMRQDPLVEIGAHSVTHARISSLPPAAALSEMAGSRKRLENQLGIPVRHFAFPYGRSGDCGRRDFALAREAGFASAATTRKGLVRRNQDPFGLPRNTLNGGHRNPMLAELHLTGMTGIAARIFGRV